MINRIDVLVLSWTILRTLSYWNRIVSSYWASIHSWTIAWTLVYLIFTCISVNTLITNIWRVFWTALLIWIVILRRLIYSIINWRNYLIISMILTYSTINWWCSLRGSIMVRRCMIMIWRCIIVRWSIILIHWTES